MTDNNNGNDRFNNGDTDVAPPPSLDSPSDARPPSIPPLALTIGDEKPIVTTHGRTAQVWADRHPWVSHHSPKVLIVLPEGESFLYFLPKAWSGSPYQSWNGGAIATGGVATAQMAATAFFKGRATLTSANATFLMPARLDLPLYFRAKLVKRLSTERILMVVTWFQFDGDEMLDQGTIIVLLTEAAGQPTVKPAAEFEPYAPPGVDGPYTVLCKQLVDTNPYFSHMNVNIVSVTENGAEAYLDPSPRMLNTHGFWADGVLYAFGDALACYACVPTLGEAPSTLELKLTRIAQAPANARLFGRANVLTKLGRRNKVYGEILYLAEDGTEKVVGLVDALIIRT